MTVGLNHGRMWFDVGDIAPAVERSGYLHQAQGFTRLVTFAKTEKVWARAVERDTDVMQVTGLLANSQANQPPVEVYSLYAELPDPTTVVSGSLAVVLADPSDVLRGVHVAIGPRGGQAQYWQAAS